MLVIRPRRGIRRVLMLVIRPRGGIRRVLILVIRLKRLLASIRRVLVMIRRMLTRVITSGLTPVIRLSRRMLALFRKRAFRLK